MYCLPSISVYTNKDLIFCNNPTGLEQKDRNNIDENIIIDATVSINLKNPKSGPDD